MILSTHAVVGGAIASLFPSHPILAMAAGFASHFAIDAIPHWDYPLRSITAGVEADNRRLQVDAALFRDVVLIGLDACAGLAFALFMFASPATAFLIGLGAVAAMAPDALQFVYSVHPREPLKSLQRFHSWVHSKKALQWRLGISSQASFAAAVAILALKLI